MENLTAPYSMKKIINRGNFILVVVSIFALSCNNANKLKVPAEAVLLENIIPITLQPDSTFIHVNDFFVDEKILDSASAAPFLDIVCSPDKKFLILKENNLELPPMFIMKLYCGKHVYDVMLKRSQKIPCEFRYTAFSKEPNKVEIAGDFNGWSPAATPLNYDGKVYSCTMQLNPGKYAYQLVVDNQWMLDPLNPNKVDNNMGGVNSVISVGEKNADKKPSLHTSTAVGNVVRIGTRNKLQKYFVFWENFDITDKFALLKENMIEIRIPDVAAAYEKSSLRVYSYNSFGASNDVLIPIKYGNVVKQTADLNRSDKQAMMMYFMMVDRFKDGDKTNNFPLKDSEIAPLANYMGGDLAGIDEKIEANYFSNLGINTIWISPIVQNPNEGYVEYPAPHRKYSGYHGYWPISSSKIDCRFGNEQSLESIIKHAHSKDMNILLDFVSNHVHEKHPLYINHKSWTTPIDLPDGRKNIRIWDEQRLTTWFDTFLPDIDYTQPVVIDAMSDSAMYWIEKYNIDGFRHDATKHVSEDFWRALTMKMKTYAMAKKLPVPYQIGETFGSRELIGSYVNSGEQHAQFDFNLYFDARSVFINDNEPFTKLSESLNESFNYYGWHSLMGNISGNHDIARFISYAGGDLKFNEDDKEAGWKRKITVKNKIGYQKLGQLMAFIATIPGVPVIYYGDEFGMPGAGDPDNRRMMNFSELSENETNQLRLTQKLFKLRKNNMALLFGDYEILRSDDKTMAYARYYFNEAVFVIFNKGNQSANFKISLPAWYKGDNFKNHFNGNFTINNQEMMIEMPANSFEIITSE
jgi:glycosidase